MTQSERCADWRQLRQVSEAVDADAVLARDVPGLRRQLHALQARCGRGQPVDRGLRRLQQAVQASQQRVEQRRAALPDPDFPVPLPVVQRREDILDALRRHQVVVLCGETGSGKTTQLPKLCLQLGRGVRGKIAHTQPRRVAARSLAARIAEELRCPLGEAVGYRVRFHDRVQDSSYIKVMTDGMLLAEIQSDPELREYDTLIIDEAHERSLNIDFLLGFLHQLLPRRPDLKLIITSATIDPQRFARHFGDAPVIEVSGRTYPVEVRYRPLGGDDDEQQQRSRDQAIVDAVDELAGEGPGDILVFLPGERAIRETAERLRKHHPPHTRILPLYARLSAAQQDAVFARRAGRRIVLATNVAETSLTVPGIHYVVDTGLARISRYNYRTKVQRLPIEPVSQASANQRAGRCGRVAAGVCVRLYDEADYQARDAYTTPEIQRTNLASVILQMRVLQLGDIEAFPFLDPPDPRYIRDGYKLLQEIGAMDERKRLTTLGQRLARLPVDPRLGRMILAADEHACLNELLVIVAVLEAADPRDRPLDQRQAADEKHALFADPRSDFVTYLNVWNAYVGQARHLSQNKLRQWCRTHFISWVRMREWIDIHRQLRAEVQAMGLHANDQPAEYQAIHTALLSGMLGHIALHEEGDEYLGARNLRFALFPGSGLGKARPRWLVAAERVETGRRYLRTVASIEPQWAEPLAAHLVKRSYAQPRWDKRRARVVADETVTLYGLALVQGRKVDYGRIDPVVSRELFIRHALVLGEWSVRETFVVHNRAVIAGLETLEAKARRRDILVDEDSLFAFFDARIPPEVVDLGSFKRWWKAAQRRQPERLFLTADAVQQGSADQVTANAFPDRISVRGLQLAVKYRFDPGSAHDGVCVQVPLVALNQLRAEDFEWLIPGLRQEKCALLIKSLPKPLRRHFVPAPDFARACLQAADGAQGSLTAFLAQQLQRMTGVSVPDDAWRPDRLPVYLFVLFDVVDEQGRVLASGRDLAALQVRFAAQAQQDFAAVIDAGYERQDVRDWDFGTLPEFVEVTRAGLRLRAYPALAASASGRLDLRLFDQQAEAERAHFEGLLALFRRQLAGRVKDIRRAVPGFDRYALWFSTLGSAAELLSDLECAVLQRAFFPDGEVSIREAEVFKRHAERGRARLLADAVEIGGYAGDALEAYHQLMQAFKKRLPPDLLAVARDIQQQALELVYRGFICATPPEWLPHVPRFLRAAQRRLEYAGADLARDREKARVVEHFLALWSQAGAQGRSDEARARFRWLIEELRVSLFAQALGTSEKVSPQRLEKLWAQLREGSPG